MNSEQKETLSRVFKTVGNVLYSVMTHVFYATFLTILVIILMISSCLSGCSKPWTFCVGDGTRHSNEGDNSGSSVQVRPHRPDIRIPLPPRPDRDGNSPRRDDWTAPISAEAGYSASAITSDSATQMVANTGRIGFFSRSEVILGCEQSNAGSRYGIRPSRGVISVTSNQ